MLASAAAIESEVDRNYDAFRRVLGGLMREHGGKVALLRGGEIVGFFEQAGDALAHGRTHYPDHLFSVQPVEDEPVDLGYFSHAGS